MMFQGTYQTPFYRQLHALVHADLELRQRLDAQPVLDVEVLHALDRVNAGWFALGQLETQYRSASYHNLQRLYPGRNTRPQQGMELSMTDVLLTHGYFLSEDEKEQAIMKPYPPSGSSISRHTCGAAVSVSPS